MLIERCVREKNSSRDGVLILDTRSLARLFRFNDRPINQRSINQSTNDQAIEERSKQQDNDSINTPTSRSSKVWTNILFRIGLSSSRSHSDQPPMLDQSTCDQTTTHVHVHLNHHTLNTVLNILLLPPNMKFSGWPGHLLPNFRKPFKSSKETLYPARCNMVYCKAHAWPLLRTNRSRFHHPTLEGANFIISVHKRWAMGAQPMGAPGWPELAAWGWSAETARMVLTHFSSKSVPLYAASAVMVNTKSTCSRTKREYLMVEINNSNWCNEKAAAPEWLDMMLFDAQKSYFDRSFEPRDQTAWADLLGWLLMAHSTGTLIGYSTDALSTFANAPITTRSRSQHAPDSQQIWIESFWLVDETKDTSLVVC